MAAPFAFDRTWQFPMPPEALWDVFTRTDRYPSWWSWLREFDVDEFATGATARCVIRSPLPYALRCQIYVDALRAPHSILTTVTGDLRGPARLEIGQCESGSIARLAWSLDLGNPRLANLARVARPAMKWAHDRVVAIGVEQFRERALIPQPECAL